ncbi:MAG: polysaccharide deacetylase family protein [Thermodesulfobacteriota bacterium]
MNKCSISVDMDPIDHYLQARSYSPLKGTNLNAVYEDSLPRFLDVFDRFNVRATFFVVAKDAQNQSNRVRLREIVQRGHEIANHTCRHYQYFVNLPYQDQRNEIQEADKILSDVVGGKISGFRAPGWGITSETLDILESLDYRYDSSVFPSSMISLISYVNWLMNKGRLKRSVGSSFNIGMAPKVPYHPAHQHFWKKGNRNILEMPPTVLPFIQFPFLGTVLYLFGASWFKLNAKYVSWFARPLLYELHGLELVDYYTSINDPRLKAKPGLLKTIVQKEMLYELMLTTFRSRYQFVTMKALREEYT